MTINLRFDKVIMCQLRNSVLFEVWLFYNFVFIYKSSGEYYFLSCSSVFPQTWMNHFHIKAALESTKCVCLYVNLWVCVCTSVFELFVYFQLLNSSTRAAVLKCADSCSVALLFAFFTKSRTVISSSQIKDSKKKKKKKEKGKRTQLLFMFKKLDEKNNKYKYESINFTSIWFI